VTRLVKFAPAGQVFAAQQLLDPAKMNQSSVASHVPLDILPIQLDRVP
jgi:hypothetical protein